MSVWLRSPPVACAACFPAVASTAHPNAFAVIRNGVVHPLIFRRYCSATGRTSPRDAGVRSRTAKDVAVHTDIVGMRADSAAWISESAQ